MCGKILMREAFDEHVEKLRAFAVVHGYRYLWFELRDHFASSVRRHGEGAADGDHGNIDLTECLDLFRSEFMGEVAEVGDADRTEIENKGGALKRVAELLLIDRHAVDQDVADRSAHLVPFGAVVDKAAENQWLAFGDFDVIMIGVLAADGNDMRRYVRCGVHARGDRIGDYFGAFR